MRLGLAILASAFMVPAFAGEDSRLLTADQLARLLDIGSGTPTFDVSPDGGSAAFQLVQPDPDRNNYRREWYVLELDGHSSPFFVTDAGQPALRRSEDKVYGVLEASRAQWSADSKWFAFLTDTKEGADLWIADRGGGRSRKLASFDVPAPQFQWLPDGSRILVKTSRNRAAERALDEQTARAGYLFDERFRPDYDPSHPLPVPCDIEGTTAGDQESAVWQRPRICRVEYRTIEIATGEVRASTQDETVSWSAAIANMDDLKGVIDRKLRQPARIDGLWTLGPEEVAVLRKEGPSLERTAIYVWSLRKQKGRLVVASNDVLADCQSAGGSLVCIREAAASPQKLVRLSLRDGNMEVLFDPNRQISKIRWGRVKRLHWSAGPRLSAFADLVYPVEYDSQKKYPLIVVQYRSRGFLRGGVGDEYPIHVFSANGFFVLSYDAATDMQAVQSLTPEEYDAAEWYQLSERKRELAGLEGLLDLALSSASIDPARIGITGLSDGAEAVGYALIHSKRFAAASASGAFWSPLTYELLNNRWRHYMHENLGDPQGQGLATLSELSVGLSAKDVRTPLLYQVADREMLTTLYDYRHLEDAGAPVEMYVFPDEYHVKWQPAHRLSIYKRNLQWFAFWLQDKETDDPLDPQQHARWRALHALRQSAKDAAGVHQHSCRRSHARGSILRKCRAAEIHAPSHPNTAPAPSSTPTSSTFNPTNENRLP